MVSMKKIPLSQGKVAIIDDSDYKLVASQGSWYFDGNYAAQRKWLKDEKRYESRRMHRWLLKTPAGMDTDHINGDKLDNRRCNLRICTRSVNKVNSATNISSNSSGYKGVHLLKNKGKYMAFLSAANTFLNLGEFTYLEDAIGARVGAEEAYSDGILF